MRVLKKRMQSVVLILATGLVAWISFSFVDEYFEVSKNLDIFSSLYRDVNTYYVDTIEPGKLMKSGIDAMLESLDPYTNYIPESEIEDYRFMTTGQYGGIGALIRQKGEYVVISDPYEGYPAQKCGLMAGDTIFAIDGQSARNKRTDEVSKALKGAPNTEVHLLIRRDGSPSPIEMTVVREEIKIKSVPYAAMVGNDIAYIRLTSFTEKAGKEVADAFRKLRESNQVKGVVLDLRGNPGGLLNEAVNVSNVFVERGEEIVSTKGKYRDQDKTYQAINVAVDKDMPMAVLVNSGSASASEIVSGSLQDLDRAVIVGQRSYGKGLVQTTRPLSYNSQLKLTIAKYYIPSGRCIQALDYSHRNPDGSVGKVPDSLKSAFRTRSGRLVYDGGGIEPDLTVDARKLSNISLSLLNKNLLFDFATHFRLAYPDRPVTSDYQLSDQDWSEFLDFLKGKDYDYTTESEKSLAALKEDVEQEKYLASLEKDIDALQLKLTHDKSSDLVKNRGEIAGLLQEEIISRYKYQSGRIGASLLRDPELQQAVDLLHDPVRYSEILDGTLKVNSQSVKK